MIEEKTYKDIDGKKFIIKQIPYPEIIQTLKRELPPREGFLWHSFE